MRFLLFFVFSLIALLAFPSTLIAQESGGISVNPAYIDVEVQDPAEKKEFEITYTNKGDELVELEIFSIDFRQTDERGVIGFLGEESDTYEYRLSSFLTFETNSLQLEPGETKSLTAIVSNRQDLSPGGHYAAIIGRLVSNESTSSATTTKVSPAVSSLVYLVKKGGERYNLSLKEIDWPIYPVVFSIPSTLVLTFQNEGNVHLTPFGTISLKDMFGREVYKGSLNNSSFKVLPSSRRFIPAYITSLTTNLPITFMTMEIKGADFGKNTNFIRRESFIYINPWAGLILIALLIGVMVLLRKKRIKKHESRIKD